MADGRVTIDVIMDDGSVKKGVANLNSSFSDLGAGANNASSKIKSIAGAVGAVAIVGKVFEGLKSTITDAVKRVDTLNNAQRTFKNMGFSAQQSKAAMAGLNKSIKGLPTSLDQAVSGVQLLAGSTGDIGKSQQVFSALNDGIIGFGGSTDNVNEAVRQLSQAFAGGKVDAETWNSMLDNGLGPALNAVAKKMGMTSSQLKDGLSTGKVSVTDFQNALIDLDKNGGGGLVSLHQIALDATAGIGTTFTNMKTAAVRAMASLLTVLQGPIVGALTLASNLFSLFSNVVDKVASAISNVVKAGGPMATVFRTIGAVLTGAGASIATFVGLIAGMYVMNQVVTIFNTAKVALLAFANPVTIVIAVIAGLVVAFMTLYNSSQTMQKAFASIKTALSPLKNTFADLKAVIDVFVSAFKNARNATESSSKSIANSGSGFKSFLATINKVASAIDLYLTRSLSKVVPYIQQFGTWLGTGSRAAQIGAAVFTKIGLALAGITGPLGLIIAGLSTLVVAWMKTGQLNMNGLTTAIQSVANNFGTMVPKIAGFAVQIVQGLASGLSSAMPQITGVMIQVVPTILNAIVTALPALMSAGTQIITSLVNAIVSVLPSLIQAGVQIITSLMNAIIAALPTLIQAGIQIITALLNGIVAVLPMLIMAGMQILMALVNAIIQNLPQILNAAIQIITALLNGLVQMLPLLLQAAIQIIMALVTGIIQNLPQIIMAGVQLIMALATALIQMLPQLVIAAFQLIVALVGALISAIPQLLSAGVQLISALLQGILSLLGAIGSAAIRLGTTALNGIKGFISRMLAAGKSLVQNVVSGISSGISKAASAAKNVANSAWNAVKGFGSKMLSAGKDFVNGFVNGIKGAVGKAVSAAKGMAKSAVDAAKNLLHIHSPSRVMFEIGSYTGEGFTNGIQSWVDQAGKVSKQLAGAAVDGVNGLQLPKNDMLAGLLSGNITAEAALNVGSKLAPTSNVVNNYNTTNNSENGMSGKALKYLQVIAGKSTVIDGSSVARGLSSFSSSVNAERQAMTERGLAIDTHI